MQLSFTVVSSYFRDEYLPRYASSGAAGMDLYACLPEPVGLVPGARERIPTGIAIQLPTNEAVALVYARSGLSWNHGIALPNGVGVIDSDYTGEIQVLLTNFGNQTYTIYPGDRIAQLVIAPIFISELTRVSTLNPTERGDKGFGSTGIRDT